MPEISVVIKALNEERHIAGAIESALAAIEGLDGEVVLADSKSTDRTVEIARQYNIRIVSMVNEADRSCGAGAQLAYQHSLGAFVYLLDGDMVLQRPFLLEALAFLKNNPSVAGVGGQIVECEDGNLEFVKRSQSPDPDRRPGLVTRLDCGGLYRRTALQSVGYLADRNLHGGEELELGARLRAQGWLLARLPTHSIDHFGHAGNAYALLLQRMRSRVAYAFGEIIRGALGKPHFRKIFANQRAIALSVAVYGWLVALLALPFVLPEETALPVCVGLFAFPFAVMMLRTRSLRMGAYSVTAWVVFAISMILGLFQPRIDPLTPIESVVVQDIRSASERAADRWNLRAG